MPSPRRLPSGKLSSRNGAEACEERERDPAAAAATGVIAGATADAPDDEDMSDEHEDMPDLTVEGHEALEVLEQIGAIDDW